MPSVSLPARESGSSSALARTPTADRATLNARYLEEVARQGHTASGLRGVMPVNGMIGTRHRRKYLSKPLFIGHAEAAQVHSDLGHVGAALADLPDLLYDGDLRAFARDSGLTEVQTEAALLTKAARLTEWVRADMYPDDSGLRLLEFNMGSGVAGADCSEICRAMLRYPLLRDFAAAHRLGYPDTMGEQIRLILAESGFGPGSSPMVAIVDWPAHYEAIKDSLLKISRRWRESIGLDTHPGHVGQLKMRNGRVWLRGRPVDIIFRIFLSEHLLDPDGPGLILPVLQAVARGEVALFTPMDGELYGSKVPLAMLSDHANRHLFSAAQLAAFDRVLPWTRMMRPGPVTLEDGSTVDLMEYALASPGELMLKPALLHGGVGMVPGWHPDTTEQVWRDSLSKAMGGPYVLQRRVRAVPEMCPGDDGDLVAWETTWGVFRSGDACGFGGAWARAFPTQTGKAVAVVGSGLYLGACLVEQPPPDGR